jgi:fatty acid-binding protein DegV
MTEEEERAKIDRVFAEADEFYDPDEEQTKPMTSSQIDASRVAKLFPKEEKEQQTFFDM